MVDHRVTDQKLIVFFPKDNQVMGIELKTHLRREIGKPVNGSLQTDDLSILDEAVQVCQCLLFIAIDFRLEFNAQPALNSPDDGLGKHPIGQQRHPVDFNEREISKGEAAGQAEDHGF